MCLKRKVWERLRVKVGDVVIWVTVLPDNRSDSSGIRLGLDGPEQVEFMREELLPETERYGQGGKS